MRLATRFVVCTLALVTALVGRNSFAEPASPLAGDHEVAQEQAVGTGHVAVDEKGDLKLTPVTEWDPDMETTPFNSKQGLRLLLAYAKTQADDVRADSSIKEEEKAKIIEYIEKIEKAAMVTFRSVNDYTSQSNGIFICPIGAEIPLQFLLPKKLQKAKLSVAGAPCIFLTMTKNYGADKTNGFVFGLGGWGGAQIARNDMNPNTGNPVGGQIEIQSSAGFILPMDGRAPVLKLGDIQGWYLGGGVELTRDSSKTTENNGGSAAIGAYAKVEGIKKPDVALIMGVVGRNDQLSPFHIKGEMFHMSLLYGTDGSRNRHPSYPLTNNPIWESGKTSPHRPEERLKKMSSQEILEIIKKSKEELKKTK